jgi:hypothetical protein
MSDQARELVELPQKFLREGTQVGRKNMLGPAATERLSVAVHEPVYKAGQEG